jgi:hypothetical protein
MCFALSCCGGAVRPRNSCVIHKSILFRPVERGSRIAFTYAIIILENPAENKFFAFKERHSLCGNAYQLCRETANFLQFPDYFDIINYGSFN